MSGAVYSTMTSWSVSADKQDKQYDASSYAQPASRSRDHKTMRGCARLSLPIMRQLYESVANKYPTKMREDGVLLTPHSTSCLGFSQVYARLPK
jgi:hypothetical protein